MAAGAVAGPAVARRLGFDPGLILAFVAPHSGLAQVPVQERIPRVIGAAQMRALYVVATGVSRPGVMGAWQTLGGTVWELVPPRPRQTASASWASSDHSRSPATRSRA